MSKAKTPAIAVLLCIVMVLMGIFAACDDTKKDPVDPVDPTPEPPITSQVSEHFSQMTNAMKDAYSLSSESAIKIDANVNTALSGEKSTFDYSLEIKGNIDYRNDANSKFYARIVDKQVSEEALSSDPDANIILGLYYEAGEMYILVGGGVILLK